MWNYCPECGCRTFEKHDSYNVCVNCGQDWYPGTDYTNVVRAHLSKTYQDKDAEIARYKQLYHKALGAMERLKTPTRRDVDAMMCVLSSLVAAISLLERGGKKAAASDTMFNQMLLDYKAAVTVGRKALRRMRDDDDQAYDSNAERLTKEALGPGAEINPDATSVDDLFLDGTPPNKKGDL